MGSLREAVMINILWQAFWFVFVPLLSLRLVRTAFAALLDMWSDL